MICCSLHAAGFALWSTVRLRLYVSQKTLSNKREALNQCIAAMLAGDLQQCIKVAWLMWCCNIRFRNVCRAVKSGNYGMAQRPRASGNQIRKVMNAMLKQVCIAPSPACWYVLLSVSSCLDLLSVIAT